MVHRTHVRKHYRRIGGELVPVNEHTRYMGNELIPHGMKTQEYTVKEERYLDCPYCQYLLSDDSPNSGDFTTDHDDRIEEGAIVTCKECGKSFKITGGG